MSALAAGGAGGSAAGTSGDGGGGVAAGDAAGVAGGADWPVEDDGAHAAAAAVASGIDPTPSLSAPHAGADFYHVEAWLAEHERSKLAELREFLAREVLPHASRWWDAASFPVDLLPKLAALGLSAPIQQGYSPLFQGLVIAELTRADTSIATFFMVHHDLYVEALHQFGTPEQQQRLLGPAQALEETGAFALTEPEHGSDISARMETTVRRDGDDWILNGRKRWIGNGTFCDRMVLWCTDESTGEVRGFFLDANAPGVTRTRIENKIALRTVQNADLVFQDVRVPESDRMQGVASFNDVKRLLLGSRIMVAWQAVGQQLAAFDVASAYAREREQFGRPIGANQLVQGQLVQILGNAVSSMSMLAQLAHLQRMSLDHDGSLEMPQAALAKSFTSARMRESVALARSILGGNGIVTDYRAAKIFADAEAIFTYEGSFEVNTLIVGRDITGISAFK